MSSLINQFEKDLKIKISQKQVPNLNEEQTLIKFFKYFDLENTGYCYFRDFVKAVEKLGVFFSKVSDIQEIFNNYDLNKTGKIDYKLFAKNFFSISQNQETDNSDKALRKLDLILVEKGGSGFLDLYKEFKIFDVNNSYKVGIDDFIKCITNHGINLSVYDIQLLFNNYETYNNGLFFYEEMFKDLKQLYWNQVRDGLVEKFIISKNLASIKDLEVAFTGQNKNEFITFLNNFIFVKNLSVKRQTVYDDIQEFFKFFTYGVQADDDLKDFMEANFTKIKDNEKSKVDMNNIDAEEERHSEKGLYNKNNFNGNDNQPNLKKNKSFSNFKTLDNKLSNVKVHKRNELSIDNTSNNQVLNKKENNFDYKEVNDDELHKKFVEKLSKLNRKSLISMLKYFKYYDNDTKYVNKADFMKVIKDFRLNLTLSDIETMFDNYSEKKTNLLNHRSFMIKHVIPSLPNTIESLVNEVFERLAKLEATITTDILKTSFNKINHPLFINPDECLYEFIDSFEVFHYHYLNHKSNIVTRDEFKEFYQITNFLNKDDSLTEACIKSEWKGQSMSNGQKYNKEIKDTNKNLQEEEFKLEKKQIEPKETKEVVPLTRQAGKSTNPNNRNIKLNTSTHNNIFNNNEEKADNEEDSVPQTSGKRQVNSKQIDDSDYVKHLYKKSRPKIQLDEENVQNTKSPIEALVSKLRNRGIRGLMHFHKEFLVQPNIKKITQSDFLKLFKLQKITIDKSTASQLFDGFSKDKKFLDFHSLFTNLKKPLQGRILAAVEEAFNKLDNENSGMVLLDDIKLRFNPNKYYGENIDQVGLEFIDTFELNMSIVNSQQNNESSLISFQEFANYFEYVAFAIPQEEKFCNAVKNSFASE